MVIKIWYFKKIILMTWIFLSYKTVQSQEIVNIISKDTLKVISIGNTNTMIVDDFKIYLDDFTLLFSKQVFLKYLKAFEKRTTVNKVDFENENHLLANIIKKNKDLLIIDFTNISDRRIWSFYLKPILNELLNDNKIVIFHRKQIIKSIHKLRVKRIDDEYSSTSIEYWHNDIMILNFEIEATIE